MNARQNSVGILLRPATLLDVLAKHLDGIGLAFFSSGGVAINEDDLDSCESGDQANACSHHARAKHAHLLDFQLGYASRAPRTPFSGGLAVDGRELGSASVRERVGR